MFIGRVIAFIWGTKRKWGSGNLHETLHSQDQAFPITLQVISGCQWVYSHIILPSLGTQKHVFRAPPQYKNSTFIPIGRAFSVSFHVFLRLFLYVLSPRKKIRNSLVITFGTCPWLLVQKHSLSPDLHWSAGGTWCLCHCPPAGSSSLPRNSLQRHCQHPMGRAQIQVWGLFKHNRRELWTVYNSNLTACTHPIEKMNHCSVYILGMLFLGLRTSWVGSQWPHRFFKVSFKL